METETETPETETQQTKQPKTDPDVSVAVGLALLRAGLDHNEDFVDDYGDAILASPYVMKLIEEIPKAYLQEEFLESLIRVALRANGQNDADEADVTPLVAAVKKEVQDFLDSDEDFELLQLTKYMFVAGRLSHEAETRPL